MSIHSNGETAASQSDVLPVITGFSEEAGASFAAAPASGAAMARQLSAGLLMAAVVSQSLADRILVDGAVRDGLKMQIALELDKKGDVNMESITRHNIIPRKTWESALKSGADVLTPVNSERVLRVARVTAKARETFGRDKADLWLERETSSLGNQPPMALLATESGARAVELLLGRIDHGFAA